MTTVFRRRNNDIDQNFHVDVDLVALCVGGDEEDGTPHVVFEPIFVPTERVGMEVIVVTQPRRDHVEFVDRPHDLDRTPEYLVRLALRGVDLLVRSVLAGE